MVLDYFFVLFSLFTSTHDLCFHCTLFCLVFFMTFKFWLASCSVFFFFLFSTPFMCVNCVFAGTWSLIIFAVRPSLGKWGNERFYWRYESRSGPSLRQISVRLSIRLQTFDNQTERQVETFPFFILGEGVWSLLWL